MGRGAGYASATRFSPSRPAALEPSYAALQYDVERAADAPFDGFGSGGNQTISIIARLNPDTGKIERGTFLMARLTSNNDTNSMGPEALEVSGDQVVLDVNSYAWPPGEGATQNNWNYYTTAGSTPLALCYTFPADLTEISEVHARD